MGLGIGWVVVECRLNVTPQCGDDADGLALQSQVAVFSLNAFRADDIERDIQWNVRTGRYEQSEL